MPVYLRSSEPPYCWHWLYLEPIKELQVICSCCLMQSENMEACSTVDHSYHVCINGNHHKHSFEETAGKSREAIKHADRLQEGAPCMAEQELLHYMYLADLLYLPILQA